PFTGRFHTLEDFAFGPLPVQQPLPILVGGRAEAALRRAGTVGDGYHSSATSPETYATRIPIVAEAATAAGRPTPALSARVRVEFGDAASSGYAMRGDAEAIADQVRTWASIGVEHIALYFDTTDPTEIAARVERFHRDVVPLI
ncbi:MAG: LLM class flavin-dependent oxidoreductase, partial [Chloroflexota bacterium]